MICARLKWKVNLQMRYTLTYYCIQSVYIIINTGNSSQSPFKNHVQASQQECCCSCGKYCLWISTSAQPQSPPGCPGVAADVWGEGSARHQSGTGIHRHIHTFAFPQTNTQTDFCSIPHQQFLDSFWVVTSIPLTKTRFSTPHVHGGYKRQQNNNITK